MWSQEVSRRPRGAHGDAAPHWERERRSDGRVPRRGGRTNFAPSIKISANVPSAYLPIVARYFRPSTFRSSVSASRLSGNRFVRPQHKLHLYAFSSTLSTYRTIRRALLHSEIRAMMG